MAIKLLPADKVADADRKRRFVQEARAASALNHPNILHVGESARSRHRASRSQARQYHGHGRGTGEGPGFRPKLTEHIEEDDRTLTMAEVPRTEDGTIVGTVYYMSPEQAQGRRVDGRSDIFSFGAVLYEMLTARRAFQGDTKLSTLAVIARDEPKPVSEIAEGLPRELSDRSGGGGPQSDFYCASPQRRSGGESEWIQATDGTGIESAPWWSPDGGILYFLSKRDGFQCIWAQRLDKTTQRPLGAPFDVAHFHGSRHKISVQGYGPGIAPDKLVFTLSDSTGNIWTARTESPK